MTVVAFKQDTGRSPRQILREWIRFYIEDKDEVRTDELVPLAYAKFANDPEFVDAMLRDGIGTLVPIIANEVWGADRKMVTVGGGSGAVTRERLEDLSKQKFARMFENAGDGKHMSLLAMRRKNLDVAVETREQDVDGRLRRLNFLREVRDGMKNERQTVSERYSEQQLNRIWDKHYNTD